jgi:hypothetical protein
MSDLALVLLAFQASAVTLFLTYRKGPLLIHLRQKFLSLITAVIRQPEWAPKA